MKPNAGKSGSTGQPGYRREWGSELRRRWVYVWFLCGVAGCAVGVRPAMGQQPAAGERPSAANSESANQEALAVYADAANFQNEGELELAIEEWQKFLKRFPQDDLAPKAAHYLGVCRMQLSKPDYAQAAAAFERALKAKEYELREESLSNLGWCLYALGSEPGSVDAGRLQAAVRTFQTLLKEFPTTTFADRALFYTGEAFYALERPEQALKAYDALLGSKIAETSALRCDAMYAKGVALEDLQQYAKATRTYREMLETCGQDPLAATVRLRLAEVLVLQKSFEEAEQLFAKIIAEGDEADRARAMYRRAFVLAQLDRGEAAAALYERLIAEYPDSPYASSSRLAAAQSLYRAGKLDEAAAGFQQVIATQSDLASATEAAHWIAVIAMGRGEIESARRVAREQIERGVEGPYALSLRLDGAEALSMLPGQQEAALAEFEALLEAAAGDPRVLSRVRYNAAFTALQLGKTQQVQEWLTTFEREHADSPLLPDMQYLAAEAAWADGQVERAADIYRRLLEVASDDHPQRATWILRAAAAGLAAERHAEVIRLLEPQVSRLETPEQRAEAWLLIGNAQAAMSQTEDAIASFARSVEMSPDWSRAPEALLRKAEVSMASDKVDVAIAGWREVMSRYPDSPMADRARYQMAQNAVSRGEIEQAVELYDALLADSGAQALRPFALYGKGYALLQADAYEAAIEPLSTFLDEEGEHPLRDDAMLARAMAYRRSSQPEAAEGDFKSFLAMGPEGVNRGHGLYELALLQREMGRPEQAIVALRRLLSDVPDYPDADDVWFELAMNQREVGEEQAAAESWTRLLERDAESEHAAAVHYYLGQWAYQQQQWARAEASYGAAAERADVGDYQEKSLYRLGWSRYQQRKYEAATEAFERQIEECPTGGLFIDAMMMVGESFFSAEQYEAALAAYQSARDRIEEIDGADRKFSDRAEQQVRELVYLHGGQSAAQLEDWKQALGWYEALRKRYPDSSYLPQVFYETGFAHQQLGDTEAAVKFFRETANNFRDESAARARFMLGEIYFAQNQPAEAIKEFKRVMYGFGGEKAPEAIQAWQAKSGFEAGRCAELLVQANRGERRRQAIELATRYYEYVTENHGRDALAKKARDRLDVLKRL